MRTFERRWVSTILGSFVAEGGPGLAPCAGEVDYDETFAGMRSGAQPLARVGLRAALWLVALAPVWLGEQPRTLDALPLAERQRILTTLLDHPLLPVREAAFMLKVAASFALFASDPVRARSGYDGAEPIVPLRRDPRETR